MELVNQTPVPAGLVMSQDEQTGTKFGIITAKATFNIRASGQAELVTQDPYPLFDEDVETELGLLPADNLPRRDSVFEVILLGAAYAKDRKETPFRSIELSVGKIKRRMAVYGDRRWLKKKKFSVPAPFLRMPLTYDRAFGGACEAWFDEHTVLDVEDRMNKYGRGFDAEKLAKDIAAGFKAPKGFPRLDYLRMLPNLENPQTPITRWDDAPEPYCWAAMPPDIGFRMIRMIKEFQRTKQPPELDKALGQTCHRAHPDWIIPLPPEGSKVVMTGLTPAADTLTFNLPCLRVVADYILGQRVGKRELDPHMLVLLPEEKRFYLVYRSSFTVELTPEMERSFRLRLVEPRG